MRKLVLAVTFPMALGLFAQETKSATDAQIKELCEQRVRFRDDGTDNPMCRGIAPQLKSLEMAHQMCREYPELSMCAHLMPLSMAMANAGIAKSHESWWDTWRKQREDAEAAARKAAEKNKLVLVKYQDLQNSLRCRFCKVFGHRNYIKKVQRRFEALRKSMDERYEVEGGFQIGMTSALLHAYEYGSMDGIEQKERDSRIEDYEKWQAPLGAAVKLRIGDWAKTLAQVNWLNVGTEKQLFLVGWPPNWLLTENSR